MCIYIYIYIIYIYTYIYTYIYVRNRPPALRLHIASGARRVIGYVCATLT